MKGRTILIFLFLTTILKASTDTSRNLQASSYTITASRSSQLGNLCTNTNRNQLYNKYGISGNVKYMSQFSNFYNLDGTIFSQFLDLNVIGINDQLRSNSLQYSAYILPAFLGPALLIFIAPILLFCLCCPSRCCLRKKLQYTTYQKMWPFVFTFLLAVTIIAACFVGVLSDYRLYDGYQQLSCGGIIGVDDALYGSQSYHGDSYFAGIQTINTQLQILSGGSFKSIQGNLSSLSSTSSTISNSQGLINSALYSISVIPDPSTNNLVLNYSTPLISDAPTSTIPSTFPPILGSYTSSQTLVGSAYASVNNASTNISSITATVDSFQSSSSAFTNSVNQLINATAKSASSLKSTLLTVKDMFTTQNYFDKTYYLQRIFYGIIIGLAMLYLLALTCFVCSNKVSCRYLLNFLCLMLFLAALTTFVAFFILTYTSAIFNSGCQYFNQSITNPNTFITNIKKLGISQDVATQYSVCLLNQNGDILSQISGQQNKNYLDNLKYVMTNITSFNGPNLNAKISEGYAPLQSGLQKYSSQALDISDSAAISELNFISAASNFECSKGGFSFDSWIPSIHQTDTAIKCKSPTGMPSSDNSTCTSTASFNSVGAGCFGCMDTFSLLYKATSQAEAYNILDGRYTGCSAFNTQLANIWKNYYLIKKNALQQVSSREYSARQSLQTATQSITNTLQPTFQNTISQLYSIAPSILTPNYGVLWGLSCKVIGEDMILFQQTACTNTFSYSYFHRMICAIVAFGLMVLLCCNTCIIFRRRKQILQAEKLPVKKRAQPYIDPLSDARLQNNYL